MKAMIGTIAVSTMALCLAAASPTWANLVQNGSFESTAGPITVTTVFGSAAVTGWTESPNPSFPTTPTNGDLLVPSGGASCLNPSLCTAGVDGPVPASSPDGKNFVFSDADFHNGVLSQTINGMTVGQLYELQFWDCLVQDLETGVTIPGPVTGNWSVSVGTFSQSSPGMTAHGTLPSSPATFAGWNLETMFFTAQNTSDLLSFLAVGTGDPPLVGLDGVSITEVPEPRAIALLVLSGLVLATVYRRRRWKYVAA